MTMDFDNSYWKPNYNLEKNMERIGKYCANNNFTECTENYLIKMHKLHKDT